MALPNLAGLSILMVDDKPEMRRIIKLILNKLGASEIHEAASTAEANFALQTEKLDAVLLDFDLGSDSGPNLIKRVRQAEGTINQNVPIIMLTGHAESEKVREAMGAGADSYMVKPVMPDQLGERILAVVSGKKSGKTAEPPTSERDW